MILTSITELLIIIVRWVHISSAVIWVGGGMFYLIAIRPINRVSNKNLNELIKLINKNFANISDISILSLTSTGAIIMLNALLQPNLSLLYVTILTTKLFLAVLIFAITINKNRPTKYKFKTNKETNKFLRPFTNYTFVTITGILIIILSDILRSINIS